jgi:hypothetical protein
MCFDPVWHSCCWSASAGAIPLGTIRRAGAAAEWAKREGGGRKSGPLLLLVNPSAWLFLNNNSLKYFHLCVLFLNVLVASTLPLITDDRTIFEDYIPRK